VVAVAVVVVVGDGARGASAGRPSTTEAFAAARSVHSAAGPCSSRSSFRRVSSFCTPVVAVEIPFAVFENYRRLRNARRRVRIKPVTGNRTRDHVVRHERSAGRAAAARQSCPQHRHHHPEVQQGFPVVSERHP